MGYKIKEITNITGLSRSTLLYYERIGLIKPEKNIHNEYRFFSDEDLARLKKICIYRDMGVSLKEINSILEDRTTDTRTILENQLTAINDEITKLKKQQATILKLLKADNISLQNGKLTKETWVKILRKTGLNDNDMHIWHQQFEKNAPEAHTDFLRKLGITEEEVIKIKEWSAS